MQLAGLSIWLVCLWWRKRTLQFEGASAIDKTVSEMTGMQLMWAFMVILNHMQ
jgi:hypothetical protein